MKNFLVLAMLAVATIALAQDRTLSVNESGVDWTDIHIWKPSPDDGGCLVSVTSTNDAGQAVQPGVYSYNGSRCTNTIRVDALKAAKHDLSVGNGSVP